MELKDLLTAFGPAVLAYIACRLAIRQHVSTRVWDEKHKCYQTLINNFQDLAIFFHNHWFVLTEATNPEYIQEIMAKSESDKYKTMSEDLKKNSSLARWYISRKATATMTTFARSGFTPPNPQEKDKYIAFLEHQYKRHQKCLNSLISDAREDLGFGSNRWDKFKAWCKENLPIAW